MRVHFPKAPERFVAYPFLPCRVTEGFPLVRQCFSADLQLALRLSDLSGLVQPRRLRILEMVLSGGLMSSRIRRHGWAPRSETLTQGSISRTKRRNRFTPVDFSASGGFRGWGLCLRRRCRGDRLGRNFESILVHIESLFPVQAFDKLACRLTDRSRKTRRIHFDRRFHHYFISIPIAKLHLKRFHAPNLPFLTMKTETGSCTPNHVRVLKLSRPLPPTTLSTRNFRSGALRFAGLNLCLKPLVLFRQSIAGSCH